MIYLDNAATTPVSEEVISEMHRILSEVHGNPSSIHIQGRKAKLEIDESRKKIATYLNVNPQCVIFTSGGTEANNFAIKGVAKSMHKKGRHIITSRIEHASILETCKALENEGYEVTYINVHQDGTVDIDQLEKEIRPDTILISIMHANNEVGAVNNIEEIHKICKKNNTLFHIDAIQSFGKIDILDTYDFLSLSAHKIHGPKGIGALVILDKSKINALLDGGHQEFGLRSGTQNVSGIVGFGKAVEIISDTDSVSMQKIKNFLWQSLANVPNVVLNSTANNCLPNILNISFLGVSGQELVMQLSRQGIMFSTGSACSSSNNKHSHVLASMGKSEDEMSSSIRLSLSRYTSIEDAIHARDAIIKTVNKLLILSQ